MSGRIVALRRWAVLPALLGLVVLWLLYGHGASLPMGSVDTARGLVASTAAPEARSEGSQAWRLLNQATQQADAAGESLVLDAAELQRRDEADCARTRPALERQSTGEMPEGPAFEWNLDNHQFDAWLRRWIVALRQRGDERSLAAVDFLESLPWRPDAASVAAAARRLHGRARHSGDGFVLALAAARECRADLGCRLAVPRDRWAQLEPDNFSAWLAGAPATWPLPDAWLSGLLQATRDNSHRGELMALLLSLPPILPPGPRRLARDVGLIGLNAALEIPQFRPLTEHCSSGADPQRCRVLAEKVWVVREPDLIGWNVALRLARQSPPIDPVWESRARQAEAALQWARKEPPGATAELLRNAYQCKPDSNFERQARGRLLGGEGAMLLGEIKHRGLDIDSLSAEYRKQNGRSLLQPPQAPAPSGGGARP